MTVTTDRSVSSACVPVSTTGTIESNCETKIHSLIGKKKALQLHLIGRLVHSCGWTLGQDGNLYSPNPAETAWGDRVN
jgi:hypothetical protein